MDNLMDTINALLELLIRFGDQILVGIVAVASWLRAAFKQFGIPPIVQMAILIGLVTLLIRESLRLFSIQIWITLAVVLLLIAFPVVLAFLRF